MIKRKDSFYTDDLYTPREKVIAKKHGVLDLPLIDYYKSKTDSVSKFTDSVIDLSNKIKANIIDLPLIDFFKLKFNKKPSSIQFSDSVFEESNEDQDVCVHFKNDLIKELSNEDKDFLRENTNEIVEYLKKKSGYKLDQLVKTNRKKYTNKQLKDKERLAEKLFKRSIKLIVKNRATPLTYTELGKKLEKVVSVTDAHEIEKCVHQLRIEMENDILFTRQNKNPIQVHNQQEEAPETQEQKGQIKKSGSVDSEIMLKYPKLCWRDANERARILFYKNRLPSIHYNEKQNCFHVSMLIRIIKNGKKKLVRVPVTRDYVDRLLLF